MAALLQQAGPQFSTYLENEVRNFFWLLLQKYIYEADKLLRHLDPIIIYFRNEQGLRFLRAALLYIEVGSGLTITEVEKAMEHTDPVIREEYMSNMGS